MHASCRGRVKFNRRDPIPNPAEFSQLNCGGQRVADSFALFTSHESLESFDLFESLDSFESSEMLEMSGVFFVFQKESNHGFICCPRYRDYRIIQQEF